MRSKLSLEGYLLIDHRASPGLPKDFLAKLGLSGPAVGEGASYESPTITCCHCGTVVILNPQRTRPRNHCRKCDKYVCDNPACSLDCKPFNQVLDEAEKLAYREEQNSKLIGFNRKEIKDG